MRIIGSTEVSVKAEAKISTNGFFNHAAVENVAHAKIRRTNALSLQEMQSELRMESQSKG